MPYERIHDLPQAVREHLPEHAQEIYLKAYNNAWDQYAEPEERRDPRESREEVAHKVAWSAVKQEYEKDEEGRWVRKGGSERAA